MEIKHTQGPWEVEISSNHIVNEDHGVLPFAIKSGYTLIGALYQNDEKARLIAAAPDLLALAQRVAALNENAGEIGAGMLVQLVTEARKAVKKATE